MKDLAPLISVIVPIYNEEESIPELNQELEEVLGQTGRTYEIIYVDDGSTDGTLGVLQNLTGVGVISFVRNYGKSKALEEGFKEAKGKYILTLDGDLQDDPHEIPKFLEALDNGVGMVTGWKQKRLDSFEKRFFSKIANGMTRLLARSPVHDMNCGFKGYQAYVAKQIQFYGDMHRYIPVIVTNMGYTVTEVPVHHRQRVYGHSKYGVWRLFAGFFDLATLLFIRKFFDRPMHFFGVLGLVSGFAGFCVLMYLTWAKLVEGQTIGNRPLLFLGILLMVVGIQVFSLGLVGDLVVRTRSQPEIPRRYSVLPHEE